MIVALHIQLRVALMHHHVMKMKEVVIMIVNVLGILYAIREMEKVMEIVQTDFLIGGIVVEKVRWKHSEQICIIFYLFF